MKVKLAIKLLIVVYIIYLVPDIDAQTKSKVRSRLNQSKPTVYLEFREVVKDDLTKSETAHPSLRFFLHNNTIWQIYYYLNPRTTRDNSATLAYGIEDENGKTVYYSGDSHIQLAHLLAKGESIPFLVPSGYLIKGHRVYVEFNYEWEERDGALTKATEPSHRVYFSSYKLPMNLQSR